MVILFGVVQLTSCSPSYEQRDPAHACNLLETPTLFLGKKLSVETAIDRMPDGDFVFVPSCEIAGREKFLHIIWRKGAEPPPEVWQHYHLTYANKQPGRDNPPVPDPPFRDARAITGFLVADTKRGDREWVFDGTGYESNRPLPM